MQHRIWLRLKRLNYKHVLPDLVLIVVSLYLSLFLRLGSEEFMDFLPALNRHLVLFIVIRFFTFFFMGVYDLIWRYVSMSDAIKLVRAVGLSSILVVTSSFFVDLDRLPRAMFFIDMILSVVSLLGIRFGRRFIYEHYPEKKRVEYKRNTLVYGAGKSGRALVSGLSSDPDPEINLVGFIDDNKEKAGRIIAGTKVRGTLSELELLIREFDIQELFIAINHIPPATLREAIKTAFRFGIRPKIVNRISQANNPTQTLERFRSVDLSDLLNRPKRHMDLGLVREQVRNKRVLVTGAGGSIGSELARQIHALRPAGLFLLDHSEFNLYEIDKELRFSPSDSGFVVPLLVDVKNKETLEAVFQEYSPEIVIHAAAYKHVHIVEANPLPSILNNVFGTKNIIELCERYLVKTFLLVSTDKAVNPVGVMGATKRLCELMVAHTLKDPDRKYCAVRFGNVLGSSGSLIPLLTEQIKSGGPITITHKDVTRYFMLIPEAVSLVLKAATVVNHGEIALLKMGEPVKILDIAKSLIILMGKDPKDIPIQFTGLRPGEKLFEELYICGNEIKTDVADVLIVPKGDGLKANLKENVAFWDRIDSIIQKAKHGNREAVIDMHALVRERATPQETAKNEQQKDYLESSSNPPLLVHPELFRKDNTDSLKPN